MGLPEQLLEQAQRLATLDATAPRQANLRRAISSAYYALFHKLVGESVAEVIGVADSRTALGHLLARAYEHPEMKKAAATFGSGGALPTSLVPLIAQPVPSDLQLVGKAFIELQEARHEADYNLAKRFSREEALAYVARAETAFQQWNAVRREPAARLFRLMALLGNRLTKR